MRLTKIVSGLVALVMTVSVMLAFTSVTTTANGAAKTKHDLVVQAEEIGGSSSNKFRLFGTVSTYKGRKIIIQRKVNKGQYTFWKKTKTSADKGKFSERIYGGKRGSKICYKVVVPKTKNYKTTKRAVACITTV
jgi:hypothetical protein